MTHQRGVFAAVSAYVIWGLLPLYFAHLGQASAADILEHRVLWSAFFLLIVLALRRQMFEALGHFLNPRLALALVVSGLLIGSNWFVYAYAVLHHQTLEASLAYFIGPLITALFGRVFFAERLAAYHVAALVCGCAGVLWQLVFLDHVPWIALVLAVTFSLYGVAKKHVRLPALQGLWLETLILLPVLWSLARFVPAWDTRATFAFAEQPVIMAMLVGLGITTTVPLVLFSEAAQTLPLVAMALLQYLSPSIKFAVAVLFLGESLSAQKLVSYGLVWVGVAIFTAGSLAARRRAALAS